MSDVNYAEVLADLKARRDKLNHIIAEIEELMGVGARREITAEGRTKKRKNARDFDDFIQRKRQGLEAKRPLPPAGEPSLSELIRETARQSPRTSVEIADAVQKVRPGADRNSVSTLICQLVKAGELRKDEQLKVHFIPKQAVNGKAVHA